MAMPAQFLPKNGRILHALFPAMRNFHALRVRIAQDVTRGETLRERAILLALPHMAYNSFREFLKALEAAGELRRITPPLATELEISELADREMKSAGGGRALLVEKPTVNGSVSPFPLAINALGSWKRMALSLGADSVDDVAAELEGLVKARPPTGFREAIRLLGQALDLRFAKPKSVRDGPCKEVIRKFDEGRSSKVESWPRAPDWREPSTFDPRPSTLLDLPIQKCWPLDGGCARWTAGCAPASGARSR